MESEPDTIVIHTAEARDLAKLLDPDDDSLTIYLGADPAIILRHQLEAPLADELSSPIAGVQSEPVAIDPGIKTFADLFSNANPPIELLKRAKDFAKACRTNPELLPPPVATVLYYAAIVAARLRLKQSITQLADTDLRVGLEWAIAQNWVDEKTKELFKKGLGALG